MRITPLGDSALIVCLRDQFEDAPEETLSEVLRAFRRLQAAVIPGVIELAPAYTTVAMFFDPVDVVNAGIEANQILDWLTERVREIVARRPRLAEARRTEKVHLVEIPVCYDAEFGFDLADVARHAGISTTEVVDLHSAAEYRASCIGFTPGFPFLTGLPKKLATPRRTTPRKEIPAGSVGIGGAQTGVYPIRSPGGWNIIGRTPLRLFDPEGNPPASVRAGDRVRFRAITAHEFEKAERDLRVRC